MNLYKMYPDTKFYVSHFSNKYHLKDILESYSLQPLDLQKSIFKHKYPEKEWYDPVFYEIAEEKGNVEKYSKSIFYSIIFPDNDGIPIFSPYIGADRVYFIFSPKIIEDNVKMLGSNNITELPIFCQGWYYGKFTEEKCTIYNTNKSLVENLNNFRSTKQNSIDYYHKIGKQYKEEIIPPFSGTLRSELLMEGEMPIESDLLYIYVPKINSKKYPKKMIEKFPELAETNEEELQFEAKLQILMDTNPHLPWIRENPFK